VVVDARPLADVVEPRRAVSTARRPLLAAVTHGHVPAALEPTPQVLCHLVDDQVADVADARVDGERRGAGGRQPDVCEAARAAERSGSGRAGASSGHAVDVGRETAAAERVLAGQDAWIGVLVGAERTCQKVHGARLGVVQLVKTGIHDSSNDRCP